MAELGHTLSEKLRRETLSKKPVQQIINIAIKDSIIQRSNLLSYCNIDGTCTGNIVIDFLEVRFFKKNESQTFANSDCGILLAGVSNNGEVIGINIGSRTIEGLINKITDNIDPVIYPKITVEVVDGKNIILIEVEKSFNKPQLVEFDGELCENATYDDLSLDAIKEFKKKYEYINKKIVSSDLDLLESLKCVKRVNVMV